MLIRVFIIGCIVTVAVGAFSVDQDQDSPVQPTSLPDRVSFNAHIRPIMSNTCFVCHGPDEEANLSDLRLDSFEAAVEGGAIKPGNALASVLFERLTDKDSPMPPADFRHQLSPHEIELLRKWIEQGADYEQHWSFMSIERPDVPEVAHADRVANPIDAFILQRLEQTSPELADRALVRADKRTLLRRLSLDLTGLPPTNAELEQFLADDSADAYERQVDRLLASPRYGERMASSWLDVVRFSDTVGFHGDQNHRVFAYRDYVIESINDNKPFDQFTKEQLAGDLLDHPTDQQRIATALIRLNMMTREGGAQPGEYIAKYTADRVRTIGTAWLGLTTGCAECHNHKYDPLTIRDFYSLGAFFDDIQQWGVYHSYDYTPNPDLRGFSNDHPFPPELRSQSQSLIDQIKRLELAMACSIVQEVGQKAWHQPEFLEWLEKMHDDLKKHPDGWTPLAITEFASEKGTDIKALDDTLLPTGQPNAEDVITVTANVDQPTTIKAIRLEVLPDEANGGNVGRSNGRFSISMSVFSPADQEAKIAFAQVDRLNPNRYYSGFESRFLSGAWRSGPARWQLPADEMRYPHTAVYHLESPLEITEGQAIVFKIASPDIGRFRISISPLTRYVAGMTALTDGLQWSADRIHEPHVIAGEQLAMWIAAWVLAKTPANDLSESVKRLRDEIAECRSGYAMTMVTEQADPKKRQQTRVLPRGNWQDESGEKLLPDTPSFLPKLPDVGERQMTRLDLANWLTSKENPLTARHFANRTWKHFFGTGLSNQLDDLGNQGEWPSHPELLDWLAAEFQSDWDMKKLVRLIVTSNTYQQCVAGDSRNAEIDPYNRLLASQAPRRLEAETVRDNALAISGLLNVDYVGGPSVFPYQPENYYANLQFPDRRYVASPDFLQYRRGVYVHWQRTFLHPSLLNFDAPARDECVADRPLSNSPQQALTLLNDPQFVEMSVAFANRLLNVAKQPIPTRSVSEGPSELLGGNARDDDVKVHSDFTTLLDQAFTIALSRPPSPMERDGLERLYQRQKEHYTHNAEDRKSLLANLRSIDLLKSSSDTDQIELAAWSQVCRVILNLHETITRY